MKSVLARLKRLERMAQTDGGVAILELLPCGEWELMMDGKRSIHPTQEAGQKAHKEILRKRKSDESKAVLIIIDL